ncbi:hypothetical protein [Tropicimonas sp. S265A]|uniref:hypothetical protein n=1 Tax=Tropicimonas sp. S265A TaxID=3415134 RepID=UPI003C7BC322
MTVTAVTLGHDGEFTDGTVFSNKQYASSENYRSNSVEVHREGMTTAVQSMDDLRDTDIVVIQGMQMDVAGAKSLGVIDQVFSANHSPQTVEQAQEADEVSSKSNTGFPVYDNAVDGLNSAVEAGVMQMSEALIYDTSVAEVAGTGMDIDEAAAVIDGLASGEIAETEVDPDTRSLLSAVERSVETAATDAARAELGRGQFEELETLSSVHPGVTAVIRQYAIDRASGRAADTTWTDVYHHVRSELGL